MQLPLLSPDQTDVWRLRSSHELAAVAIELGAASIPGWTPQEDELARSASRVPPEFVDILATQIANGDDPLGDLYCQLFSAEQRRPKGAVYTPQLIVRAMLEWSKKELTPSRIIDPGAGSGRFLVAAGRAFPQAELVAIELDPLAAILARAHLAAAGLRNRSRVVLADYREAPIPAVAGRTLFLGNPPYVRHHLIQPEWKQWLVRTARRYGHEASQLAGLHVYFFLATAEHARPGDIGLLITAAEWLDVNYGRLVRELLLGSLGVKQIEVIEPAAVPFPGTATTAVITGFEVGSSSQTVGLRKIVSLDSLCALEPERHIRRERLEAASRWTPLIRAVPERREGFVELGELCRVHRGQVTGANRVWIAENHGVPVPESALFSSITRARELFQAKDLLPDASGLRHVVDLPPDLAAFDDEERQQIERFLRFAKSQGADRGYVAQNRKAWWSVGLRDPAPILATYMARRPPAFVVNAAEARHINIAHGLYPREPLSDEQLAALARYLARNTSIGDGRTYSGGLTKFEPREMERLLVPRPEFLADREAVESML